MPTTIFSIIFTCRLGFFIVLCVGLISFVSSRKAESATDAELRNEKHVVTVRKASLTSVLVNIRLQRNIVIEGLGYRGDEIITVPIGKGPSERIIKRLLQVLGEKNYALEYIDDQLKRVLVFPSSKLNVSPPNALIDENVTQAETVDVVEIQDVIDGTQAKVLGLQRGDFIVSYDGIRINRAVELIREIRMRSSQRQIEMVVSRNGENFHIDVRGGFLGVRIKTQQKPRSD